LGHILVQVSTYI